MAILVVDDEQEVRESLREVLRTAGYRVIMASGGREALHRLDQEHVALMLVDLSMPGMSGEELLMAIQRRAVRPKAVVVTALSPWSAHRLLQQGFGYVRKPVNGALLLETVRSFLNEEAHGDA